MVVGSIGSDARVDPKLLQLAARRDQVGLRRTDLKVGSAGIGARCSDDTDGSETTVVVEDDGEPA